MKVLPLMILCLVEVHAAADIVPGTVSPNHEVAVEREGDSWYFVDTKTQKNEGDALPSFMGGVLASGGMVVSWSANSKLVAVLIYYGTRMNCISVFCRQSPGGFREIPIEEPRVNVDLSGKSSDGNVTTFDVHSLGPWIKEDTIKLITGQGISSENESMYSLVVFDLKVHGGGGEVLAKKQLGPMKRADKARFFNKWGTRYWKPADEE